MTPDQKLAAIQTAVTEALAKSAGGILRVEPMISAKYLQNILDLPATTEHPDMVSRIKHEMQLHAADCLLSQKISTNETRCTCWLENPNEAVYTVPETKTVFTLRGKNANDKLHNAPAFLSRQEAIDWLGRHTLFSIYPENKLYWANFYDIKEKEITTA